MRNRASNLFSLQGRIALITGGAGLLGREYAKVFLDAGATVILFDIVESPKFKQKETLRYFKVDIVNKKLVFDAVRKISKKYGEIDVLVNNAALNPVPGSEVSKGQFAPYEDYPQELWENELSVNLSGALFVTQAVVPFMKKQKSGSIINISSIYGNAGPDNRLYENGKYKSIGYATTKGAVLNFTRAWATYLRGTNIRVNTLTLGGVFANQDQNFVKAYNEKTVLGRMADKTDFNGAILFLASGASRYMTGANLIIDGGWTAW
ncbi:MAG: SDR family oxidoreductase [Candidatus Spechtbacteria bacterium]|nr:SDR family oxidoreductase [Candidatus Spechtbacteria bacterium]